MKEYSLPGTESAIVDRESVETAIETKDKLVANDIPYTKVESIGELPIETIDKLQYWWSLKAPLREAQDILREDGFYMTPRKIMRGAQARWGAFERSTEDVLSPERQVLELGWRKVMAYARRIDETGKISNFSTDIVKLSGAVKALMGAQTSLDRVVLQREQGELGRVKAVRDAVCTVKEELKRLLPTKPHVYLELVQMVDQSVANVGVAEDGTEIFDQHNT